MKLEICQKCLRTPIWKSEREVAYWCSHTGTLLVESKETGMRMCWSPVTQDEVPVLLGNQKMAGYLLQRANEYAKAKYRATN